MPRSFAAITVASAVSGAGGLSSASSFPPPPPPPHAIKKIRDVIMLKNSFIAVLHDKVFQNQFKNTNQAGNYPIAESMSISNTESYPL
jgi:hypothetical protein